MAPGVGEIEPAAVPGQLAQYTVLHHVYNVLSQWTSSETYLRLANPGGNEVLTAAGSLQVLAWICVVSLAAAPWRFRQRAYLV